MDSPVKQLISLTFSDPAKFDPAANRKHILPDSGLMSSLALFLLYLMTSICSSGVVK